MDRLIQPPPVETNSTTVSQLTNNNSHCCNCIAERLGPIPQRNYVSPNSYLRYPCEDEPPPYASLINPSNQDHITWTSYAFPSSYEDSGGGSSSDGNRTIARPLVSIPLTSYGIYKIEPPRYASVVDPPLQRQHPRLLPEAHPVIKNSTRTAKKYGAILIAATVIIFLMALSLMVRFVTEKSLWRG